MKNNQIRTVRNFNDAVRDELCSLFDEALADLNVVSENDFCVKKPSKALSNAFASYERTFYQLRELLKDYSVDDGVIANYFVFLQVDINRFLYELPSYSPLRHYFYKACHLMAVCACGIDLFGFRKDTLVFLREQYNACCTFDADNCLLKLNLSYSAFRNLIVHHFLYSQFLLRGLLRAMDVVFNHGVSVPKVEIDSYFVDACPYSSKQGDDRLYLIAEKDFGMREAAEQLRKHHRSTYKVVATVRDRFADLISCVGLDPNDSNIFMGIYFHLTKLNLI